MKKISFVIAIFLFPLHAFAETASPAESIAQLNERIAVKTGQLKLIEMEVQIATKNAEKAKLTGVSALSDESGLPRLRAIEGVDGVMIATLQYDDGAKINVQINDQLQDDWKVESIGQKSLFLTKGKKKIRLLLRMPSSNTQNTNISGR